MLPIIEIYRCAFVLKIKYVSESFDFIPRDKATKPFVESHLWATVSCIMTFPWKGSFFGISYEYEKSLKTNQKWVAQCIIKVILWLTYAVLEYAWHKASLKSRNSHKYQSSKRVGNVCYQFENLHSNSKKNL